ncbi:unnamed protein product, partial [Symbiodinium sp. CCMP2456]
MEEEAAAGVADAAWLEPALGEVKQEEPAADEWQGWEEEWWDSTKYEQVEVEVEEPAHNEAWGKKQLKPWTAGGHDDPWQKKPYWKPKPLKKDAWWGSSGSSSSGGRYGGKYVQGGYVDPHGNFH